MPFKVVVLWTDAVLWAVALALCVYAVRVWRQPLVKAQWGKVLRRPSAMASGVVLVFLGLIAGLDSMHCRVAWPDTVPLVYSPQTLSILDVVLTPSRTQREASYSRPLATRGWSKISAQGGDRVYPRLTHGGAHLVDDRWEPWLRDVGWRAATGAGMGLVVAILLTGAALFWSSLSWMQLLRGQTSLPWRAAWGSLLALSLLGGATLCLAAKYHVLGTDKTGNDVFYQTLKSLRTAFVIGTLSNLATLPLAVGLGLMAGYFKGWVDAVIGYVYTLLSSIPSVLLLAACVLMMQVFIDSHPDFFATSAQRSDVRLFLLCLILGLTGWAGLCRLVRAQTLKLRELEYVQAATALGSSAWQIVHRHLLPNVMHLVIITTVLDFSALVLYEAVLSYVGVGVDPSMNSFGGMINLARSEMSHDPLVWWSFVAAFCTMLALVLAANLLADGVQEAFDPRHVAS